jgi:hypothetical protein
VIFIDSSAETIDQEGGGKGKGSEFIPGGKVDAQVVGMVQILIAAFKKVAIVRKPGLKKKDLMLLYCTFHATFPNYPFSK